MKLLSFCISILNIIIGVVVIASYCIAYGIGRGSIETATLILMILGAPTTFLNFILEKVGFYKTGLLKGIWNCIPIWFFYLLQYQLIAVLIYKGIIDITTKKGIFSLITILIVIIVSATIMWKILTALFMGH